MSFKFLTYSEEAAGDSTANKIGLLSLSRPEALNALNRELLLELESFVNKIERKETSISALIVTGAGEKAFVAGADIKEIDHLNPDSALEFARFGQKLFSRLERLPIPVIAAVSGFALGGGCELALACDIVVATPKSKFGLPECTLGIMPGFGGTVRMARRVGPSRALMIAMSGQMLSAQEGFDFGFVDKLAEPEQLMSVCKEMASQMASRAPLALAAIKKSIYDGSHLSDHEAFELEAKLFAQLFQSKDQKEGTQAFIQKRKPVFSGR